MKNTSFSQSSKKKSQEELQVLSVHTDKISTVKGKRTIYLEDKGHIDY